MEQLDGLDELRLEFLPGRFPDGSFRRRSASAAMPYIATARAAISSKAANILGTLADASRSIR
jgi:hypothetical protein